MSADGDRLLPRDARRAEAERSQRLSGRTTILEVVPTAEQCISYSMPAFKMDGKVVAGFAAFKNHLSYFPHSGSVLPQLADELDELRLVEGHPEVRDRPAVAEGIGEAKLMPWRYASSTSVASCAEAEGEVRFSLIAGIDSYELHDVDGSPTARRTAPCATTESSRRIRRPPSRTGNRWKPVAETQLAGAADLRRRRGRCLALCTRRPTARMPSTR